jgi:DNA-binding transcriptional ArsR family regulator
MSEPLRFDYYYGAESDQFSFVRIPKQLLKDEKFQSLSYGAIVVYAILLDRMSLSIKNGWHDERNRVYIRYKVTDLTEIIKKTDDTVSKYLKELENIGLIERPRVGLGKGKITYVKNFISSELRDGDLIPRENAGNGMAQNDMNDFESSKHSEKYIKTGASKGAEYHITRESSGNVTRENAGNITRNSKVNVTRDNSGDDKSNTEDNNINIIKTDSYPNHICRLDSFDGSDADEDWMRYQAVIHENISYDSLCVGQFSNFRDEIDGIVDIMTEIMICKAQAIWIAGDNKPLNLVKDRIMKIRSSHIEYILDCFHKNTSKIYNIKKYLQASIFNAPSTIGSYYMAEVSHDMYGWD